MKLGAQLYTVRTFAQTAEDFRTTLLRLKEMGYENAQLSGCGPIPAEEIRAISEEVGMPIVCSHSAFDRIVHDTDALIAEHKTFNCPVIGLGSMPKEYRGTAEGLTAFFAILAEPVKKILSAGLHFAYHNHNFEFRIPEGGNEMVIDTMLRLHPDWHFIMDTYWVEYAGYSAVEYIKKIGSERLVNIHFKDMANDESRSICACGNGVLDFEKIYAACREVGVENVLVEQDNAVKLPDAFAEMETSFRHLRPIIK